MLEKELGRGGMAIVYLARDIRHKRLVALKVLHPDLGAVLGTDRFLREVETAAGLQHPHILPVFDSGETAGRLWYTMPYVEGESLRDRLKREVQLPVEDAVRLTREVAEALDYAHRHGVVHRDIKPDNILLTEGHASVADFGIAKAVSTAGGETLTQTGTAVGTPAYMSPEQASPGAPLDGRSDVYSLGCVLYEMLAGEPPFTGPSSQAIIARHCADPPRSMRVVRPGVPLALERAVERALAKVPADRFQTAGEFARSLALPEASTPAAGALAAASGPEATSAAPVKPFHRRVPAALATLAIGILLGLGVLLAWLRTRPEAGTAGPKRLAVLPFENLGRPEDGYFADGVTDEVRGKLSALPGLEVIARASSVQYKETTKNPRQIGKELGVEYLLTGTVRWDKETGGRSRVRVSPELVHVSTASTKWQAPFEAPLTDVFGVQADIAGRVAQALGVALGSRQRAQLAERPTQNLAAYDAYLRGLELRRTDAPAAAAEFERAITLDTTFALAWAELALTRQYFHSVGFTPLMQIDRSRGDAERAMALQPRLPLAYYALGQYHRRRGEYDRALAEYTRGLAVAPNDVGLLIGVAYVDLLRGEWGRAIEAARRVAPLDPRSTMPLWVEAFALMHLRRFDEVLGLAERALALNPSGPEWYQMRIETRAAQGDLAGARRELDLAERRLGYARAVVYLGRQYDPQWVLPDSAKAFLLRQRPEVMEGDTADWALTLAFAARYLGDTRRARAYADTARHWLEARPADDVPADYWRPGLCLSYALAGRAGEARRSCEALRERPSPDAYWRFFERVTYARAAVELGDFERALPALERVVREPGWVTPAWIRLDPMFTRLRGNPRFERLVAGN